MMGISGCLTVLLMTFACRKGVLAPEAGGVLPAELSEDLFSTEQRRFRSPKLAEAGCSEAFGWRAGSGFVFDLACASVSFCGSAVFAGLDSGSWRRRHVILKLLK